MRRERAAARASAEAAEGRLRELEASKASLETERSRVTEVLAGTTAEKRMLEELSRRMQQQALDDRTMLKQEADASEAMRLELRREVDAAEVMTPRTEIFAIEEDAALSDAVAVFATASFSRIPVYEGTIDTIIGTLTALEAAKAVAEGRLETTRIRDIMRPPLLVPETVRVPDLLNQFRADRQKMAIVVDEYGGTAGLVTLADVVAEIVGHVSDEYEEEHTAFRAMENGAVEADASLHVSEVNEALDLEIPEESDYETLGGFVLSEIGRFPSAGESFNSEGVTFRVSEASDRRVLRVVMERPGGLELRWDAGAPSSPLPRGTAHDRERNGTTEERERRGA